MIPFGKTVEMGAELAEAKAHWQAERSGRSIPVEVCYDDKTGRIVVDFENGATFMVPARALEGLANASEDELAEVELLGETGLHWETLDVDYTITGLMNGIFGSRSFMDAQPRRPLPLPRQGRSQPPQWQQGRPSAQGPEDHRNRMKADND